MTPLKALTVWQPWATAISLSDRRHLGSRGKGVENRDWIPPKSLVGEDIAIHAAKREFDEDDAIEVGQLLFKDLPDEAWAKLGRVYTPGAWFNQLRTGMGKILCVAQLTGFVANRSDLPEEQQRWWVGDYGWTLANVQMLERPVLCRGQQGIWEVPKDELAQLRMQIPEDSR